MPSIKDLKKRIVSVKNTQQTTRAMKMVSAAKLRRAQEAIQNHRPYARQVGQLIRQVSSLSETLRGFSQRVLQRFPLIRRDKTIEENQLKKVLLVLISSDRGLCGSFNGNIVKTAQRWMQENQAKYREIQLSFVGRKAYDFFKLRNNSLGAFSSDISNVTFAKAKKLTSTLMELFLSAQVDEVYWVYNEFKNALSQKVVVERLFPLLEETIEEGSSENGSENANYIIRPNLLGVLEELLSKNFSIQTFRVLLESQASEHGARMSAMENATQNAGEMIQKLTLQYNKQRQAGITKELLEIISGSESQKATL